MKQSESCGKCKFMEVEPKTKLNHCHRNPPVPMVVPADEFSTTEPAKIFTVFPQINVHAWCGMYEPASSAIN